MTTVYTDDDFNAVYNQRRRIFRVFMGVTIFYAAFCLAWLIYFITLPYKHPMQNVVRACVFVATALYVVFLFPFMGIKYHRVNKYYKMTYYLSEGLKITEKNYFVCFAEKDLQKDNVDVISCIFQTWNKKKCEWMEREVYCDPEKPLPPFEKGDLVRYVTQSNFLVQYEVLERRAIEIDLEDEEDAETDGEANAE